MKLESEVRSVHFRRPKYSFGVDCDISFLFKFVNEEEKIVLRIYDSIAEGNYISVEEVNGEEFDQHEMDLNVGNKSSVSRYLLRIAKELMDSELDLTKDDIKDEMESAVLSTIIDFNKELQDYE